MMFDFASHFLFWDQYEKICSSFTITFRIRGNKKICKSHGNSKGLYVMLFLYFCIFHVNSSELYRVNEQKLSVRRYEVIGNLNSYMSTSNNQDHRRMKREAGKEFFWPVSWTIVTTNRTFRFTLVQNMEIFSPNFSVSMNNKTINYEPSFLETYQVTGKIEDDPLSTVSGTLSHESFHGMFIDSSGETFFISPMSFLNNGSNSTSYIFYLLSDIVIDNSNNDTKSDSLNEIYNSWNSNSRQPEFLVYNNDNNFFKPYTATKKILCESFIQLDQTFVKFYGSQTKAINHVVNLMTTVNAIFKNVSFTGNSKPEGFQITIGKINIVNILPFRRVNRHRYINVENVLMEFLSDEHKNYCLAILFTSVSFNYAAVGASYTATIDGGGICDQNSGYILGPSYKRYSLNILTLTNTLFHKELSYIQQLLTLMHEIGHSFGSSHDNEQSEICSPLSDNGGPYLMSAKVAKSISSNSLKFSPCSQQDIRFILNSGKGHCFKEPQPYCGNYIVDDNEECDCGPIDSFCNDQCCNLPSSSQKCRLKHGYVCSHKSSECCNNCRFEKKGKMCRSASICSTESQCTGTSSKCPTENEVDEGKECNTLGNTCMHGQCAGSPCHALNLSQCTCLGLSHENYCRLCCKSSSGLCLPANQISLKIKPSLPTGSLCGPKYTGVCSGEGKCIFFPNSTPKNITFKNRVKWFMDRNKYEFLSIVIFVILVCFINVVTRVRVIRIKRRRRYPMIAVVSQTGTDLDE